MVPGTCRRRVGSVARGKWKQVEFVDAADARRGLWGAGDGGAGRLPGRGSRVVAGVDAGYGRAGELSVEGTAGTVAVGADQLAAGAGRGIRDFAAGARGVDSHGDRGYRWAHRAKRVPGRRESVQEGCVVPGAP